MTSAQPPRPGSDRPAPDRLLVLIDGFNLYHGLREGHGHKWLWLDIAALAGRLALPHQRVTNVHYFTARVRDDLPAQQRQEQYLRTLSATGVRIVEGRFQQKSVRCHSCGNRWRTYEEKESDVNLAIALTAEAARGNCDTALVISADSDLAPAAKEAKAFGLKRVVFAFPPKRRSDELRKIADAHFTIGAQNFRKSQFPATVLLPDGSTTTRPAKWT